MRCRAGRGRARLFFTLGAVRSGKRDTLLHAAPTRSTELPVRVCDIARLPGLELRYEEDGLRILDRPEFFDDCSRARSRCVRGRVNFGKGSAGTGELGSCGHHATISALAFEKELLFVDFSRTRPAFSRNKELKADAYQVA
jgi:hypothetical protein